MNRASDPVDRRSVGREEFAREIFASRRSGGFTLLEILIATAILTIGLVSIVSLFPVAIRIGGKVVETSNAVVIAQSVAEAVRDGMKNRKRYVVRGNISHPYFLFEHDGVTDKVPSDEKAIRASADYFILLPRHREGRKFVGTPDRQRLKAVQAAKTFVYPETDKPANGGADAFRADNDADDDGDSDHWTLRVAKVYQLGQELAPSTLPDDLRTPDIEKDVLKQYSYAFAITPSFFDADLSDTGEFVPASLLYHVRVMIYRGFETSEYAVEPKPVYELDFEVAI